MIYEMLEHGHNVESIYRDDSLPVRAAPSSISPGRAQDQNKRLHIARRIHAAFVCVVEPRRSIYVRRRCPLELIRVRPWSGILRPPYDDVSHFRLLR